MKNIFKFEWNRMIHSKTLALSLIVSAVLIMLDVKFWFDLYKQDIDAHTSIFYKWLGVDKGMSMGNIFFLILPLLTAFAYSHTISSDRKSGYIMQIVSRGDRFKYFASKYFVSILSGGMVFVFALVLDYMLLGLFSYAYLPSPADMASGMTPFHFCSELFYSNTYLFVILWLMVAFLWGCAMASIGVCIGIYIKNYIISSIAPFLVFMAQGIVAGYIMQKYMITVSENMVTLDWSNMFYASPSTTLIGSHLFFNIGAIFIVTLIAYSLRARKYECL